MRKILFLASLILFCAFSVRAQGIRHGDTVFVNIGGAMQPISNATIRVCTTAATGNPCTPIVSVYADVGMTIPLSNPFISDTNGNYEFFAPSGDYQIQISGLNIPTYTLNYVQLAADVNSNNTWSGNNSFSGVNLVTGSFAPSGGGTLTANAITQLTTAGDLLYMNGTPVPARLPIGTNGQCLGVVSSLPGWVGCGSSAAGAATSFQESDGAGNLIAGPLAAALPTLAGSNSFANALNSFLGIGVTSETLTNSGVFSNTQANLYFQALLNSCNPSALFFASYGGHQTDGSTFCVAVPSGSVVYAVNGTASYVTNLSTTTNAVATFGMMNAGAAGTHNWASNFLYQDMGFAASGTAAEFDCNISNSSSNGSCIQIQGGFSDFPPFPAVVVFAPNGGGAWQTAYATQNGASGFGLYVGAVGTAASSKGQQICSAGLNASSVSEQACIQADVNGNWLISPTGGSVGIGVSGYTPRGELEVVVNNAQPDALNVNVANGLNVAVGNLGLVSGTYQNGGGTTYGWIQSRANSGVTDTAYPLVLNPLGGTVGVNLATPSFPFDVTGDINTSTGFRVAGGATNNYALCGNGTKFIPSVFCGIGFSNHSGTSTSFPHIVQDLATLTTGAATVTLTGSAVFTAGGTSATYACYANDVTTPANAVTITLTSGSSLTFAGTGSDVISYACEGH